MPLKTDTFGITRNWLSTALRRLLEQEESELFARKNLNTARKAFLAGDNQLKAIKNWLSFARLVDLRREKVCLTELGKLMAARDPGAEQAWTWWLFHLHLCANPDAFPYSTFFTKFDADGTSWTSFDEIIETLVEDRKEVGAELAENTVRNYFEGVERTFRPGQPVHSLGLVERRTIAGERGRDRFRRCAVTPPPADIVVAYSTLLFHETYFRSHDTVEMRGLLEKGLGRALGMRDAYLRDALTRVHQNPDLGTFIQYRHTVNLDSVQFLRSGEPALRAIRTQAYTSEEVRWP
jgi:hypothetical protein